MTTTIWWIRRDLRLVDNQALQAALAQGPDVIPTFVLDPSLLNSAYASEQRTAFLFAGLRALDQDLRQRGSRLVVRQGDPAAELAALLGESGATAVFAEEDLSPYARQRDTAVSARLPLRLTPGLTVHPPEMVLKQDGDPYTVFTPYSKKWRRLPRPNAGEIIPAPRALPTPPDLASLPIPAEPTPSSAVPFAAGEAEAKRRLHDFTAGSGSAVYRYGDQRDLPAVSGTSLLSPYLRFGMISLRQAVVAADEAIARAAPEAGRKSAGIWLNELIWREFYLGILYHFPHVRRGSFRPQYDAIAWDNDEEAFAAWCAGRTGYPIVDAAMRQLAESGWMHNRARMITASFLVKDLLIDWRWGERWFMQRLVDGDPASNNGGWQWTAGTGTDAAPYFRIFNPTTQSKKFDPDGRYIRHWLPELAGVPKKYIHEPQQMPAGVQASSSCLIGRDYPAPIVDHKAARQRTLAAYKAATSK